MTATKLYIVEDDALIAETIKSALTKSGYSICGMSDNVAEALLDIAKCQPDLVLIDITLKGEEDGVLLAKKINEKFKIPFLYLTSLADPETLNRAKETEPVGYIVKPFNESTLHSNIEIGLYKHQQKERIQTEPTLHDFFFVKNNSQLIKINLSDILFLEAFDNYCYLMTENEKHIISHTLKSVAEKLPASNFIRVHRSYVVNINRVNSLMESYILIGRHKIPIGKFYKENFMKHISLL